ncbi:MAG: type I DNA topoisomerase [Candidatus Malihini olakiniferum]
MGKSLVIVESLAKAKTIKKYLGKDYIVKSSIGHVRDLPTNGSAAAKKNPELDKIKKGKKDERTRLVNRMGVDPFHGWKANYEILPGKEKVISELKTIANNVNHVYLATDLDREGEAIAWHLREIIGGDEGRFSRVVFNEITKNAINQAFENPDKLNIDKVNAQQARRFVDRIMGYMISPLLWKKIARGLSAGRVQSVAVRLVVEREREIKSFIPEEYWELHADLLAESAALKMQVTHFDGKPFKLVNKSQIDNAVNALKNTRYVIAEREDKAITSKPSAPFITSTLQQAASIRLGFGVKKTMMIAQHLYEAGYITYMRTDSTNLSQDALNMARDYILSSFGKDYLPESANLYSSKENSQEAHEAIRLSDVSVLADAMKDIDPDAKKLYQLIWLQFVACQMTPAKYDSTTLLVNAEGYQLRAKGRALRFDGWTKIMPSLRKGDEGRSLPMAAEGDVISLNKLLPSKHFTKPPARYSDASLVKDLEKRGIGRPSTYVSIISTIQDRGYVRVENRRFYAEKIGEIVTDRLEESFQELMNYNFTASMESKLDNIANNHAEWRGVLNEFFAKFSQQLEKAKMDPEMGGMRPNAMVLTTIYCHACGRKMGTRTASTGVFLGCSGYALPPKERCKTTINLIPEAEVLSVLEGDEAETNALRARHRCERCSTAMDSYLVDNQRKLHICGNNPSCDGYKIENGEFRIKGYDGPVLPCDKCGSDMHLKMGRFGKYMACINEACSNTRKIFRNCEVAPPKEDPVPLPGLSCEKSDAYFILRDGVAGIFLAANTFPKSRETRAPLIEEMVQFRNNLPEKLHYLADAPVADPEGNKAVVRFSRKKKKQYISSEKNGKSTGWSAFYVDGKWTSEKK